ncbi:hypothetical protein FPV67DRAFT_1629880 [Lyophyllum atratum]|nr:hypothetical protein FPV67DRAFT_1629880 [Lyophyllum atratum]
MNQDREPEQPPPPPAPLATTTSVMPGPSAQGPPVNNPPASEPTPAQLASGAVGATQGPSHVPTAHIPPAQESTGSQPTSLRQNPAQRATFYSERVPFDDYVSHGYGGGPPLPLLPHEIRARQSRIGVDAPISPGPRSGIDFLVPLDEKPSREKTVGERLDPTLSTAIAERDKYAFKAKMTGYALNIAIGLQVLLGSLTTGISAAATTGHQAAIGTTILGALATLVASYLARARGSNEPELSITRVKDLEQFIRECEAFKMDQGHNLGSKFDAELEGLRHRFEELLGNSNGERKLSPPV